MKPHLESVRASASRKLLTAFLAVQMVALNFSPAWAAGYNLPSPKDAAYSLSEGDTKMTITPSAERSTIHYNYFDIQNGYKVEFADSPASVTINKVEGGGRSEIFGVLDAQGKIYLLNSSGVLFGDGAHVNVGGLVASTFMDVEPNEAGQLVFQGAPGTGDITVQGGATINAGAFAYLVGKNVNLAGAVNAGEVLVAAFGDRQSDYDAGSIVLKLGSDNPNADGGDIDITGSFTNATSISELTGDSVAITNITLYAVKDISQIGDDSAWRADAPITLTAIGTVGITLSNKGNAFSDPVSATAENGGIDLAVRDSITLAGVTAKDSITAWAATNLAVTADLTSTDGPIKLTAVAGDLTVENKAVRANEGNIELRNGGTMTINGVIDGKMATLAATNGALNLGDGSIVSGTTGVYISAHSGDIELAVVQTENGPLEVTAEQGSIAQGSGRRLEVGGTSKLVAGNGSIVLTNANNKFGDAVTATATDGKITLRATENLVLGETYAAQDVDITATGDLTAGQVTSVSGNVKLKSETGTFSDTGKIQAATNVHLLSEGDLTVAVTGQVWASKGDVVLQSSSGSVTGTGNVHAEGATTLTASGGNIVLENHDNYFKGTVTATATNGMVSLVNSTNLKLGEVEAGDGITATAGGHLTATNMTATGGAVALTAATNLTLTGTVSVDNGNLTAIATDGTFTTAHDLEAGKSVTVESGNGNLELANVTARDGDVSATASGNLALTGTVSVTNGSLTAIASNGTFSTTQDLAAGKNITIESGSGDISLPKVNAGSNLTVTAAGGSIGQGSGTVVKAKGTTVLTAGGDYIALENDENDFGGTVTATATNGWIHLRDANDLTAGDVKAKGNVTLAAQTNLTLKGAVEGGPVVDLKAKNGNLKGEETASIKGGSNLYVYAYGEGAEVVLPETVVGTDGSGYMLVRTPQGTIAQLADTAVTVDGNTVLEAGGNIMLDNTGNDFGAVAAEGLAVTLTDKNGIALGADLPLLGKYNVTATDLTVTAKDGNITQTEGTTVTATGTTDLTATSGNIVLTNAANDFGGAVTATATDGSVSLTDANDLELGNVTAGGAITATAETNLTVTGAVRGNSTDVVGMYASQGKLTVDEGASVRNDAGRVSLYGKGGIDFNGEAEGTRVVFGKDDGTNGALTSGDNAHVKAQEDVAVWTQGAIDLPAIDAGWVHGRTYGTGDITQSGAIHTTLSTNPSVDLRTYGDGNIVLTNAGNSFAGSTKFSSYNGAVDVYAAGDLAVDNSSAKNNMTLTAGGGNLTLGQNGVSAGSLDLSAGGDIEMAGMVSVRTNLTATAGGGITQTGDQMLKVGGTTELTATAGNIVLTNAVNDFGGAVMVKATNGNVSLQDSNAILLGDVTATDLTITALAGGISQDGAAELTATGTTTLTATSGNIVLTNAVNDFGGVVAANGQAVSLRDANDLLLGDVTATTGDVTARAGGSVTNTGALKAELGTVTLQAEDDVSVAAAVTAENVSVHAGGNYTGTGTVTATQDLEIEIGGDMTVSNAMSANRDLKLAAGTNLTLEAAVEARTGTIELMAHEGDLTSTTAGTVTAKTNAVLGAGGNMVLDGAVEAGTNVTMTAGGDMTLGGAVKAGSNVTAMADGTVSINGDLDAGGNLKADAAGIEQGGSGAVTVTGTTTLTATNGNVKLGNDGNDFRGLVTATATNGSITLSDANSIDTGKLDATDAVTVTAKNDVTLTDEVTAGGNIEVTSTEGSITNRAPVESTGGNITFTARQDIGVDSGLTATAGTIKLWATNDVAVRAPVTAEGVDVYAGGNYMGDGLVTATMDLYMRVGGDLTLAESLIAARNLTVSAGTNLTLNASVEGRTGNVELTARAGDFKSNGAGTVKAGTNAVLQAGGDMELGGTVTASNAVTATAASNLTASAAITTEKDNVALTATNGKLETADKIDAGRNATLKAGGDMTLGSTVDADGNVLAQGGGDLTANQAITAGTNATLTATGSVAVNESVTATAGYVHAIATNGTLTVASGKTVHGGTDVTLRAVTGNATVGGKVEAGRNATLYAGGTLAAEGDVEAENNAVFTSGTDMTVAGNVRAGNAVTNRAVGTYTNTGTITAEAGNVAITGAKGATVSNAIEATAGDVSVATSASGALLHVAATGSVTVGHDAELTAKKGSVTLDGAVSATNDATVKAGTGGNLTTTAGGKIDAGHDAVLESAKATILDGTLTAGNSVTATAGTSMDVNADVTATAGDATLKANGGKLATTAAIVAGNNAELESSKAMTLGGKVTAGNDVTATAGTAMSVNAAVAATNDVSLASAGNMKVSAPVTAGNDLLAQSASNFTATAQMTAATNLTVTAANAVSVGAAATATAGKTLVIATNGTLTVTSTGSVTAGTDAELTTEKDVMALDGDVTASNDVLVTSASNLTVNAAVKALTGDATLKAENGTLTTTTKGPVQAGTDVTLTSKGDMTLAGTVDADNGDILVQSASNFTSTAQMTAATDLTVTAAEAVEIGAVATATAGKALVIATNGTLTVESTGSVTAGTDADLRTEKDSMTLDGHVTASNNVFLTSASNLTVNAAVAANGGKADLKANGGALTTTTNGTVHAATDVVMYSSGDTLVQGAVDATNNITANAGGSFTNTASGSMTAASGDVEVTAAQNVHLDAGLVATAGNVTVKAENGTLTSTTNGTVHAGTDATLTSKGDMTLEGTVDADNGHIVAQSASNFTSESTAQMTAAQDLTVTAADAVSVGAAATAMAGKALVIATNGTLTVENTGSVTVGTDAELTTEKDSMTLDGRVTASNNVFLTSASNLTVNAAVAANGGKADLKANGGALATTEKGTIHVATDVVMYSRGNTLVQGAVDAGSNVTATTGGTFTNTETGMVTARQGNAYLDSTSDMTVGGAVRAGGSVTNTARGAYANTATLTAETGDVAITAQKGTTVSNMLQAVQGPVTVTNAASGDLLVADSGSVVAGTDAVLTAKTGNVRLDGAVSATNDAIITAMTGTLTSTGGGDISAGTSAAVSAHGAILLEGDVTAGQHVLLESETAGITVDSTVDAGSDLVALAEASGATMTWGTNAHVSAREDMVLKADQDISLTEAVITGKNVGVQSANGSVLDSMADLKADETMVLAAGKSVKIQGGLGAETLGIKSADDIVLGSLSVKEFAAESTAGQVDVTLASAVNLAVLTGDAVAKVEADRADGAGTETVEGVFEGGNGLNGIKAATDVILSGGQDVSGSQIVAGGQATLDVGALSVGTVSAGGTATIHAGSVNSSTVQAGSDVVATVGGPMSVGALTAGHDIVLESVGGDFTATTASAGNALDASVGGGFTVETLDVGGTMDATVGGGAEVQTLTTGGSLNADIGGAATLKKADIGGDATIKSGGALTFDSMEADDVKVNSGSINMGKLNAGNAELAARGSINDNGSLVRVRNLTMTAGGDIGSAGKPINTEISSRIERIAGKNIYLHEQSTGHDILLGTIDASGHLSLSAPRIGLPDGLHGYLDANGDSLNLIAGSGLELDLGGRMGTAGDPMEAQVNGKWTILNGELEGTPMSYIYIVMGDTEYSDTPAYIGTIAIPGLVIVNGRPVLGHPDLLRKIYSALAFSVDTPELKSTQGIFGSPLFLHTDLALFNAGETGVDYWNVIQNDLLDPNNGKNAVVYGPRRWGLDDSLWDSERMSRSRLYLIEFDPLPEAKEAAKPAPKASAKDAAAKPAPAAKPAAPKAETKPAAAAKPAAKAAPAEKTSDKASAKPAAKEAASKPASSAKAAAAKAPAKPAAKSAAPKAKAGEKAE